MILSARHSLLSSISVCLVMLGFIFDAQFVFAQPVSQWQVTEANMVPVQSAAATLKQGINPLPNNNQSRDASTAAVTRVTSGLDRLPSDAGQVWRTYDISPYTSKVTGSTKPQQAVIDWIIRETGSELWFSEPFGILNATRNKVMVYNTPEVQQKVKGIIDRLVGSRAKPEVFGMRLITLSSANWRAKAYPVLEDIDVSSPGVEAWLLSKENAAILLGELRKRADFKLHNSPDVAIHTGQPFVTSRKQPQSYPQSVVRRNSNLPFYDLKVATMDEGYSLEMSPLRSLDQKVMEAVIKCHVNKIERYEDVKIEVPTQTGQAQSVTIQVPQMVSWRVVERFRWPADKVLLLSCGVSASPGAITNTAPIPKLLNKSAKRANALLFIDPKGTIDRAVIPSTAGLMTSQRR